MVVMRGAAAALLLFACSEASDDRTGSPEPTPLFDDDSDRVLHCDFEELPVESPRPPAPPAPLRAGFASERLLLPIGVPLGGYGARSRSLGGAAKPFDVRAARWSEQFVPSAGAHDVPRVDAIALEAGEDRLLLLRIDAPLVTDPVLFELERRLDPAGGWRGRIVITASHSHGTWAAWQPSLHLVPGIDRPRRDLFDQALDMLEAAARAALAALEPASLGVARAADGDPTGRVSHDRREENEAIVAPDGESTGADKDPVWWALRIDRADGTPMVGLIALPIHGTVGEEDNPLVSTDVTGAIQRALSAELGYPVLHLQGAAGDVSPGGSGMRVACANSTRCLDTPRLEAVGAYAAEIGAPLLSGISSRAQWALEIVTRTFHVGKSALVRRPNQLDYYYVPVFDDLPDRVVLDELGEIVTPIDEFNTRAGAALCGGTSSLAPIPGTLGLSGYGSCADLGIIFPAFAELYAISDTELPLCDTLRATASAIRFTAPDQELLLVTLPGEPTAPLAGYLRSRSPAGPERTLIVGYAQDYVGYLLTAEDWLAGGYEPSLNVWGPLEGELIVQRTLEIAELAWSAERDAPAGGSRARLPELVEAQAVVGTTADHGTLPPTLPPLFLPDALDAPASAQPSAQIPRAVGVARFVWLGGDPAVDRPRVEIEREAAAGELSVLVGARGTPASFDAGNVIVTYTPDPLEAPSPARHYYVASWQPLDPDPLRVLASGTAPAPPLGRYRFRVRGRAATTNGPSDYELTSSLFELVRAPLGPASAQRVSGALALEAHLAAAPGLRALGFRPSDVPLPLPGPWTATLGLADGSSLPLSIDPNPDGSALVPLPAAELSGAVTIELLDAWGNGGTIEITD
jgi:neutral ceramidase